MDVVLRQTGIGRCDAEQPVHQVDQTRQQNEEDQHPDDDGDDDPDGGDRRPARHVTAVAEGGDIDEDDHRNAKHHAQDNGKDDLPGPVPAVFHVGFVYGLREFGVHMGLF